MATGLLGRARDAVAEVLVDAVRKQARTERKKVESLRPDFEDAPGRRDAEQSQISDEDLCLAKTRSCCDFR